MSKFHTIPKDKKIILGFLLGAFGGSFAGIAFLGDAINAAFPCACVMGYMVYLATSTKS